MATLKIDVEKAPQASLVELIKTRVGELPANDRQFAYSLVGAALSPRGLTEKQAMWVRKMADRIVNPKKPNKPVEVGDISGLVALFAKAKASGLQWPKLRAVIQGKDPKGADDTVLTLRLAGEKSSHTGQIMVTTGKQENRLYYGRVDLKGAFHASQQPNDAQLAACVPVLKAIANDPEAAGKAYGARTGNCAFCSLPLEDKRSVEVGYGPVCAEKWGLEWGVKRQETPQRARARAAAAVDKQNQGAKAKRK